MSFEIKQTDLEDYIKHIKTETEMPAIKGKKATTSKDVSQNIKIERAAGYPQKRAVAIAESYKDQALKKARRKK